LEESLKYELFFPKRDLIHNIHTMLNWINHQRHTEIGPYELVWHGEIFPRTGNYTHDAINFLWRRHNEGDRLDGNRPRAREIRSMCIGDIIAINGEYWSPTVDGWEQLTGDALPQLIPVLYTRQEQV
jgi:hypothetical protein